MRILHINDSRGWRGGENQTHLLIRGLLKAGIVCDLLAHSDGALSVRCKENGCSAYECNFHGLKSLTIPWYIRRLCSSTRYDCVHAHTARAHTYACLALAGVSSPIPLVVTRRNISRDNPGWSTRLKYKRAAHVIAISRAIQRQLTAMGVTASKVSVIPSGLDLCKYEGVPTLAREELGIPAEKKIIGVVAALTGEKGHETVLTAIHKLKIQQDNVHALFVGDGPLRAHLEQRVEQMKLVDDVTFTGHRTDVGSILPLMDVYVSASSHEGLGTATLDALLAGIPVVASRVGGVPEVIDDKVNGLLFETGDADELAEQVKRILCDADIRTSLINNGYEQVKRFDIADTIARTIKIYSEVCP
ncbi:MAG: glycosyltransferase [Fibrobacterota bacterium]